MLKGLKPNQKVLVLGGGTGELLEELSRLNIPLEVEYVELSLNMLHKSEKRSVGDQLNINFIHQSFLEFTPSEKYDVIIANFFLDVFDENDLRIAIDKIQGLVKEEGKLIVTDFQKESISMYHQIVLWLMHRFFGMFSKLPNKTVLPIKRRLVEGGFVIVEAKEFLSGFVFSNVYRPY